MDALDLYFQSLYEEFVEAGGLDQTERIVNEDLERVERMAAFCTHGMLKRRCSLCIPPSRPLPPGMSGYNP